jgi:hypothetical protein
MGDFAWISLDEPAPEEQQRGQQEEAEKEILHRALFDLMR